VIFGLQIFHLATLERGEAISVSMTTGRLKQEIASSWLWNQNVRASKLALKSPIDCTSLFYLNKVSNFQTTATQAAK
jgi:hypothetical protein